MTIVHASGTNNCKDVLKTIKRELGKKVLSILLFLSLFVYTYGQTESAPALSVAERNALQGFNDTINRLADDFVTVSLVIADPGTELYSILGHAALRMQCPVFELDQVFSYESEQVHGKLLRFLANDLKMGMMRIPTSEYLHGYQEEGRGAKAYKLNLSPGAKMELWRILDQKVEEGMNLPYDYIKRGCATSCRLLVEKVAEIQYAEITLNDPRTMREQFYDNAPKGWALFECMTLVGGQVDDSHLPALKRLIAPVELVKAWQNATINNELLIKGDAIEMSHIIGSSREIFTPVYMAFVILLLALISIFWSKPYIDWTVLALQTFLGILMLWLLVSPLPGSEWSWLIVPFNPLPLICWKWRRYWALPYTIILLLWSGIMVGVNLWGHRLVDWAHILLVMAFAIVLLKQYFVRVNY